MHQQHHTDDLFGDAAYVARKVGMTDAVAFDLTAACSGFLFGMNTAAQFVHNGAYETAVVIGADALSVGSTGAIGIRVCCLGMARVW